MKPSDWQRYEVAGATMEKDGKRWKISFSAKALKRFYLHDVLIHELGHHVDRNNLHRYGRSTPDAEGFAEWFAREYGYPKI